MSDRVSAPPVAGERKNVLRQALDAIDSLQARLDAIEADRREPIAIVGMACRFPGAPSLDAYWELLRDGRDAVRPVPADRWNQADFFDPDPKAPGKVHAPFGGFLDQVDQFDAAFFGIAGREAETMDPQQRLLLEATWEALENAGVPADGLRSSATGVFVGVTCTDYARMCVAGDAGGLDVYTATGGALNVAAGRISYLLGLHGPAMAIDTACSSSLVALHIACQSLRTREIDCAITGGVNTLLTPEPFVCFAKWGMMAPDGRCKTFDERADGFVRAEGCGVIVLKRLRDAQAAGDRILAVIRGTAVNQDGASSGLTVPNGIAQQAVVRRALQDAGLAPGTIDYVEAHGTGTTLGDPIELEALATVLAKNRPATQPLRVGSVKTNIGHTESASGIAGLIKVVLALQHESIPAHLHFQKLSSRISIGSAPIEIPVRSTPWPRHARPRLAGVSSFGFSGTNAHAILEEAPVANGTGPVPAGRPERGAHLLVLSARSDAALRGLAETYARHLAGVPDAALADVCHSAAAGRSALPHRLAITGTQAAEVAKLLRALAQGSNGAGVISGRIRTEHKIAFLFTGQGSQYPGMGRALYESEPVFREMFDRCAEGFRGQLEFGLPAVVGYDDTGAGIPAGLIDQTSYTQPALFAFACALTALWRSWGIEPAAVAGHSLGEYVAAWCAGVLSLEDAIRLVALRSRLMQALPAGGAMAAILTNEQRVREALASFKSTVSVAALNGPSNVVIAGRAEHVAAIVAQFKTAGVEARPLTVSHAFHSPLIEPMLGELVHAAAGITHQPPAIDFVLNETGALLNDFTPLDPAYWSRHARGTVRFAESIQALRARGITSFLEIGPAPVLVGMARQCVNDPDVQWLASLRKDISPWSTLLGTLGSLFVAGARPDWRAFDRGRGRLRVDLPLYPFRRKRHWLTTKPRPADAAVFTADDPTAHPLLGRPLPSPLRESQFACALDPRRSPMLREHRVAGLTVFPAAGYLELAHAAATATFESSAVRVERGCLRAALILDEQTPPATQLVVTPADDGTANFEVFSRARGTDNATPWVSHAGGRLSRVTRKLPWPETLASARARCGSVVDVAAYQQRMHDVGLEYGPSFRALVAASCQGDEAFGELRLPATDALSQRLTVHPGLLDAAFHLLGLALADRAGDLFYLPVGFDAAEFLTPAGAEASAHVRLRSIEPNRVVADVLVWRADGTPAASVSGLQVRPITRQQFRSALGLDRGSGLLRVAWRNAEPLTAETRTSGAWEIIGGSAETVAAITQQLTARGATTAIIPADRVSDVLTRVRAGRAGETRGLIDLRALDLASSAVVLADGSPEHDVAPAAVTDVLELFRAIAARPAACERLRVVIPTLRAQMVRAEELPDPTAAIVWGIGVTAAAEVATLDLRLLDVDALEAASGMIVAAALRDEGETRLAVRSGALLVARLVPVEAPQADRLELPAGPHELVMRARGTLDGLGIAPRPRTMPGRGQVEIEVLASGLNFRDVLNLLDMYPGPAGALGNECCGRVVTLGDGVDGLAVGDLVTCIASATFATHVITPALLAFPVPASLSVAQAAAFPIAQLTAFLALHRIGRIATGDRVLIHAGAGGVGLAAVHQALAAGAIVLASAGSAEKRDYLRSLGVQHVFDSRHPFPAADVLAVTEGHGLDLLLNSLTGEFIDEGLKALAAGGRFLEIGLREMRTAAQVSQVRSDITYHPLLLGEYCQKDPAFVRAMYDEVVALVDAGRIPAPRTRAFPLAEAGFAFRHMAKARHIGRLALVHRASGQSRVRPDASYLVTGGLGGLGLHMADWLATQGARHVILLGRSEPSPAAERRVSDLRARGVAVELVRGDVARPGDLAFLAQPDRPPVRGVIHAAGIVDDAVLPRVDGARLQRVLSPKAQGAQNLLRAIGDRELDFFVLFSSGSAILGSPGQAAYAGANAFLDALAARLHGSGCTAVSINWGAWAEGGMAARLDPRTTRDWAARGIGTLSTAAGASALEHALVSGLPQVAALPMDWPKFFRSLPPGPRPAFLAELAPDVSPSVSSASAPAPANAPEVASVSLRETLAEVPASERLNTITNHLRQEAAAVLGVADPEDIDAKSGLTEQGMDSLMAVEFANRLGRSFGVSLPATFVFDYPTLTAVSRHLLGVLMPETAAAAAPTSAVPKPAPVAPALDADIHELNEADLENELRRELDRAGF